MLADEIDTNIKIILVPEIKGPIGVFARRSKRVLMLLRFP